MSLKALLDALPIPILQAPMLGAAARDLALAVCGAGGLGAVAVSGMAPAEIEAEVAAVRREVQGPFAANLFVLRPIAAEPEAVEAALERLRPWYEAVGEPLPQAPNADAPDFDAQFAALVRAAPPIASFTFGVLQPNEVAALHSVGVFVVGTATTVAEARAWAAVGADGICAQGAEAGGHRGHFLADVEASLVGTLALVPTVRQAVDLPVIAAGGIMDGRGVAAALALGADAVQMGTAFLLSDQSTISAPWRAALQSTSDDPTRLTRAFTGRHARGLENRFMREMRPVEGEVPAYPVQNRLTQPLRAAAAAAGEADLISLWAGQGVRLAEGDDAGEMVKRWWREAGEAAQALAARTAGRGTGD